MMEHPLYRMAGVEKTVASPAGSLAILNGVNLEVAAGESVAIVGASGSGKSTLLHILGALDTPTRGAVWYAGRNLAELDAAARAAFRNRELGFVFQFHHLLPEFNALENVAMQAIVGGMGRKAAMELAGEALRRVGLAERMAHSVTTLSGGERQRAAIARATLLHPEVLLADEPTGNLDGRTGAMVADLLLDMNRRQKMTLVVVTHNREMAARMGRILELRSGELYEQRGL
jgi:lipoprotein-releasing system ATP-binding protein